MKTIWDDDGTNGPIEICAPPPAKYRVKYWDGTKSEHAFSTINDALVEARQGLRDWMNDDDRYELVHISDHEKELWVIGGEEGPTDAHARIYRVKG